jgi:hypothetical protein
MKILFIIAITGKMLIFHASGQQNSIKNLKQEANNMGSALIAGDYTTFAKYTYPPLVKAMGGVAKMKEKLEETVNNMHQQGMNFSKITFAEPSKIIMSQKEYQSTILQHTEIKLSKGRIVSSTTLIAISTDNGNNWTFIDTTNKDMQMLRKALPNLSSSIYIPPQSPPVKYDF